uniref:RNA-directed DNA polymerase, eukaryota, reverse transcriptase zinc-binding domain protein n=1 Tax=Tanacetum cinerariifolium TaxID=118510 RepID=A0A6L2MAS7_TANCI|nr:RNA-directed DNA polymerase, eukaryota, reverse transcriptase zinc-binding domain protein [Tanacetum cinerariifolium]
MPQRLRTLASLSTSFHCYKTFTHQWDQSKTDHEYSMNTLILEVPLTVTKGRLTYNSSIDDVIPLDRASHGLLNMQINRRITVLEITSVTFYTRGRPTVVSNAVQTPSARATQQLSSGNTSSLAVAKIESGVFWVRMIISIYTSNGGVDDNRVLRELGGSGVWRDIVKVGIDLDKIRIGFSSSFSKKVGNEGDTLFWKDRWFGNVRLCDKFPRLCRLDMCKEAWVIDRGNWSEGVWRWELDWVREPRKKACGDLPVLMDLLYNVNLTSDCRDSW